MPSVKTATVARDVAKLVRDVVGGSEYRERSGVVRLAVGQLGFAPEELRKNIKAMIEQVKKDMAEMTDRVHKELHEVVLSSTHSPGFSLTGEFASDASVAAKDLSPVPIEYVEIEGKPAVEAEESLFASDPVDEPMPSQATV